MGKERQRGAIVIEATLSLTAFVFTIFTLLSIVNIYYIQARMSIALNSAAKEISQYSYLYYKIGVDKAEAELNEGTEEARKTAEKTIDGVGTLLDSLSGAANSMETGDFDSLIQEIETGSDSAEDLYQMYASQLSEDPKGFIIGMAKMAGNEMKEEVKVYLGQILAKAFMQKNLKAFKDDDPDNFLKRYRVVGGMDGLDFDYSALMAYGTSNQIQLVVTYEVQVIRLLNFDFKFKFRQVAKTTAWGNGISLIKGEQSAPAKASVWDNPSDVQRGKIVVAEEKKNYSYTASGKGFDAYNNSGGANEFVTIVSCNTDRESNKTVDGIKRSMNNSYNKMYNGVTRLGEEIVVQNKSNEDVTLNSPVDTRTYRVVLVVPDNADMELVLRAKQAFEAEHGGNVVVEIKTGYGSPTPSEKEGQEDAES